MAKKRSNRSSFSVGRATKKLNSKINIPNPFNKINNVGSAIREIPLTEKTLLIALLVLIMIVAFTTNSENLVAITGAAVSAGEVNEKITLVISIFTEGIAKPFFDLFGKQDVLAVKLILVFIFYLVLAYGFRLKDKFEGKGGIIAGLTAFILAAVFPTSIINIYLIGLIPGLLWVIFSTLIFFAILYWLYRTEVEHAPGHVMKAVAYLFVAIVVISELDDFLTKGFYFTTFQSMADWIVTILFIYSLVMVVAELWKAFNKKGGMTWAKEKGRTAGELVGSVKEGYETSREEKGRAKEAKVIIKQRNKLKAIIKRHAARYKAVPDDEKERIYKEFVADVDKKCPDLEAKYIKSMWGQAIR